MEGEQGSVLKESLSLSCVSKDTQFFFEIKRGNCSSNMSSLPPSGGEEVETKALHIILTAV